MYEEPIQRTLWEELKPGYIYFWRRLIGYRHEDPEDREETAMVGFFLFTFLPWLPIIWFAHVVRKVLRLVSR